MFPQILFLTNFPPTGFGDACYQTQLFSIFGSVYSDKSAAAFAIFKFTQSAAAAIAFFSSSYIGIFSQMMILLVTAILGFFGIFIVEFDTKRKSKGEEMSSSGMESGESGGGGEDDNTGDKNDNNTKSSPPSIMEKPANNGDTVS